MRKVTLKEFRGIITNCETIEHVQACMKVLDANHVSGGSVSNELYDELMMDLAYISREILRGDRMN